MSASELLQRILKRMPHWRLQVLAPVLVVVGLWVVMSLGTTIYLWWVEAAYERVFSENLTSIEAAHAVETIGWRTLTEWSDESLETRRLQAQWEADQLKLREYLMQTSLNAHTPEEKQSEEELQSAAVHFETIVSEELRTSLESSQRSHESAQRIREHARKLSLSTERLRIINDELIASARAQLAGTHSRVLFMRMVMLLIGPLLGIYLGWGVARRLQSSVTEIAVTLNESVMGDEPQELRFSITRESSIEDVRKQAERVVERLRQVAKELQVARKEVIQSERLAAVGELAAGVAHELRNPLTSVKLLLQHVSKKANGFRIEDSQLQLILDEVGRMEGTIQGLLDFSRTPVMNRTKHDLRETLQRSLNLVDGRLKQNNILLRRVIAPAALWIDGDAEQLNQVFVNLLLNSVEAMPVGGQLDVTAEFGATNNIGRIVVCDTGDGISPDVLPRLFEPFATTKERGTGLGLAVSRRIVTDHHGTITAENLPERGAMLVVELPLCSPAPEQ
ncbi:MAG: ATP-binding protein [Planctomycetaceae bacterium]